ncbi:MAG: aconitase X, partial [Sulfolobales archaeon]
DRGVKEMLNKLMRYNIKVIGSSCAVVSRLDLLKVNYVVTDSSKACSYISRLCKVPVVVLPTKKLIKTFLTGGLSLSL